jgi:MtfA peptidase
MSFFQWLIGGYKRKNDPISRDLWELTLRKNVSFYRSLDPESQLIFLNKAAHFLSTTRITGIKTEVSLEDKILIAAGAVIPIFAFPDWEYFNLDEVLLFPQHFNYDYQVGSTDMAVLGAVGYGYLEGKMVLSKKALHLGFDNTKDKRNTVIHEFIHLIDKADGEIDGVFSELPDQSLVIPWLNLMDEKIREIREGKSDIRPYGARSRIEFLAVSSEYFFERPGLLKKKHPILYSYLEQLFAQKMAEMDFVKKQKRPKHFEPCPCGSRQKFRECCG